MAAIGVALFPMGAPAGEETPWQLRIGEVVAQRRKVAHLRFAEPQLGCPGDHADAQLLLRQ